MPRLTTEQAWEKARRAHPIPPYPVDNGKFVHARNTPKHSESENVIQILRDRSAMAQRLLKSPPRPNPRRRGASRRRLFRAARAAATAAATKKKKTIEKIDSIPDPLLPAEMNATAVFPRRIITRACTKKLKDVTVEREKAGLDVKGATRYVDGSRGPQYFGNGKWHR